MSPVTTEPVCVSGASGFIASHVVRELLERGYRVRGTVRSLAKEKDFAHLTALPGAAARLELVEADLLRDGSFDAAVRGATHALHLASPFAMDVKDPQRDLVEPQRLADTKRNMKYGFLMGLESALDIGSALIQPLVNTGRPEALEEYFRTLEAVTPEDVRDAARTYLVETARTTVVMTQGS